MSRRYCDHADQLRSQSELDLAVDLANAWITNRKRWPKGLSARVETNHDDEEPEHTLHVRLTAVFGYGVPYRYGTSFYIPAIMLVSFGEDWRTYIAREIWRCRRMLRDAAPKRQMPPPIEHKLTYTSQPIGSSIKPPRFEFGVASQSHATDARSQLRDRLDAVITQQLGEPNPPYAFGPESFIKPGPDSVPQREAEADLRRYWPSVDDVPASVFSRVQELKACGVDMASQPDRVAYFDVTPTRRIIEKPLWRIDSVEGYDAWLQWRGDLAIRPMIAVDYVTATARPARYKIRVAIRPPCIGHPWRRSVAAAIRAARAYAKDTGNPLHRWKPVKN